MRYIKRTLEATLRIEFEKNPVVTITGPRQSGKTTLVRTLFDDLPYRNLEDIETRQHAQSDPVDFLHSLKSGCVLDEIQQEMLTTANPWIHGEGEPVAASVCEDEREVQGINTVDDLARAQRDLEAMREGDA